MNFTRAKQNCIENGGILYEPRIKELNFKVRNSIFALFGDNFPTAIWLGFDNLSGNWLYSATKEPIDDNLWYETQPDNPDQNCGSFYYQFGAELADFGCHFELPSVCEF